MGEEKLKVGVIGSGNWGTAVSRLIANNIKENSAFEERVDMWVFEEEVNGEPLSKLINDGHENVKYLPGIKLPDEVVANPSIEEVCAAADILVFVVPHEFVQSICEKISSAPSRKEGAIGVSLIKGAVFGEDEVALVSKTLAKALDMRVSSLMGANIANDVAKDLLAEGTLGYAKKKDLKKLIPLFNCKTYRVTPVECVEVPEMCGVIKNVIALGCGFADGKGHGVNASVAIMRNGFVEMIRFCDEFVKDTSSDTKVGRVYLESSGFADLVVTCTHGRNHECARIAAEKDMTLEEVEKDKMNGQKLQGYSTSKDLYAFLERKGKLDKFPLLRAICEVASGTKPSEHIFDAVTPCYAETSEKCCPDE